MNDLKHKNANKMKFSQIKFQSNTSIFPNKPIIIDLNTLRINLRSMAIHTHNAFVLEMPVKINNAGYCNDPSN